MKILKIFHKLTTLQSEPDASHISKHLRCTRISSPGTASRDR